MNKQFENTNCRYGAPMGRRESGYIETEIPRFVRLFRVRLDAGGYDDGGAYWGIGAPLWCAIDGDGNHQFIRAPSREAAAFLLRIPNGALLRPLRYAGMHYALAMLEGREPVPAHFHNGMPVTRSDIIEWMERNAAHMGRVKMANESKEGRT